jgi:hypothetical protein
MAAEPKKTPEPPEERDELLAASYKPLGANEKLSESLPVASG